MANDQQATDLDQQKRSKISQMGDKSASKSDTLGEKGGRSTQQSGHTHELSEENDTLGNEPKVRQEDDSL